MVPRHWRFSPTTAEVVHTALLAKQQEPRGCQSGSAEWCGKGAGNAFLGGRRMDKPETGIRIGGGSTKSYSPWPQKPNLRLESISAFWLVKNEQARHYLG